MNWRPRANDIWTSHLIQPTRVVQPSVVLPFKPRRLAPASWYSTGPRRIIRLPADELLSTLATASVGAVLIDPPADVGVGTTDTEYPLDEQVAALIPVADETHRVLRPGGVAISMGDPRAMTAWDIAATWAGLSLMGDMAVVWDRPVWRRPHAVANLPSLFMPIRRYVKPGYRGTFNATTIESVQSNVLVCDPVPDIHRHTYCQRPVQLYNYLISTFTDADDMVVDPYCGTGSSPVAAELNGRPWLAGDVDLRWVELSRERVRVAEVEELGRIGYWYGGHIHWIGERGN